MGKIDEASEIKATWVAAADEGMRLELSIGNHYFASFVAEEADETLYFELSVSGRPVRIPVAVLESLIAEAKRDVHSETWYDKRPPSDDV